MTDSIEKLPGFSRVSLLRGKGSNVELVPTAGPFSRGPAIYAFLVNQTIRYIGAAERLRGRLRGYRLNQLKLHSQSEIARARPVHLKVRETLCAGDEIEIFALVVPQRPIHVGGLPIDPLIGIEAGLIMELQPVEPAWGCACGRASRPDRLSWATGKEECGSFTDEFAVADRAADIRHASFRVTANRVGGWKFQTGVLERTA